MKFISYCIYFSSWEGEPLPTFETRHRRWIACPRFGLPFFFSPHVSSKQLLKSIESHFSTYSLSLSSSSPQQPQPQQPQIQSCSDTVRPWLVSTVQGWGDDGNGLSFAGWARRRIRFAGTATVRWMDQCLLNSRMTRGVCTCHPMVYSQDRCEVRTVISGVTQL